MVWGGLEVFWGGLGCFHGPKAIGSPRAIQDSIYTPLGVDNNNNRVYLFFSF